MQPSSPSSVECTSTPGPPMAKRRKMSEEVPSQLLSSTPTQSITDVRAKQKKVKAGNNVEELIVQNLHDLNQRKERPDEDEHFGRSIAAILRRFSYRQKAHAKLQIHSLLLDIEFPQETMSFPPQQFN